MLQAIEPSQIRMQRGTKLSSSASGFSDTLQAISPASVEGIRQGSGDARIASVTHAALTGVASAPAGANAYGISSLGAYPAGGVMTSTGTPSSILNPSGYPTPPNLGNPSGSLGDISGSKTFFDSNYLIDKMRDTNLQMIALQAKIQDENRQWTTSSNILKAKHDTEMSQARNLRVT